MRTVALLVDACADVDDLRANNGETAWEFAQKFNRADLLKVRYTYALHTMHYTYALYTIYMHYTLY
jgi:hypothetical protein